MIEKGYVLGWMLAGIAEHPDVGPSWVFKGGIRLKMRYFETWRFSQDLNKGLVAPNDDDR